MTRRDVIAALGPIDDEIVSNIIATGATTEELAEALAWFTNDEALMNIGKPLAGGRVDRLIEILAEIADEEEATTTRINGSL